MDGDALRIQMRGSIRVLQPEPWSSACAHRYRGRIRRKHLGPRTLCPSLRSRAPQHPRTMHARKVSFLCPESAHRMKLLRVLRDEEP